jgi:hypothetical protein
MEVSGQLHAPAALPPRKVKQVDIEYEALLASGTVWTLSGRRNFLACDGNQTTILGLFVP